MRKSGRTKLTPELGEDVPALAALVSDGALARADAPLLRVDLAGAFLPFNSSPRRGLFDSTSSPSLNRSSGNCRRPFEVCRVLALVDRAPARPPPVVDAMTLPAEEVAAGTGARRRWPKDRP